VSQARNKLVNVLSRRMAPGQQWAADRGLKSPCMSLILASASPRRAELLSNAGIPYTVDPAHVPEERGLNEQPADYAQRLAGDKARAVFARHPQDVVLGADTVVVVDEHLLEKPAGSEDAVRMLRLLSGRTHQVITGICVVASGFERTEAVITQVLFAPITEEEIAAYVRTREPMDKAGAYAIQGIASRWVEHIDGCYFNVVGLPVPRVYQLLRAVEATTQTILLQD
jgi:septum formation protein